ncbi:hypothetical protein KP509_13G082900 [Ceratopteris richardii]|uniref:Uncharacterized protein n=1 Tax=Ceratopteris richardii TaxID=49495 RepID=A0A8T2TKI0_CERRI|nr:hypothetical protein KP509_13G082900 [Ceratopteris richardii]
MCNVQCVCYQEKGISTCMLHIWIFNSDHSNPLWKLPYRQVSCSIVLLVTVYSFIILNKMSLNGIHVREEGRVQCACQSPAYEIERDTEMVRKFYIANENYHRYSPNS